MDETPILSVQERIKQLQLNKKQENESIAFTPTRKTTVGISLEQGALFKPGILQKPDINLKPFVDPFSDEYELSPFTVDTESDNSPEMKSRSPRSISPRKPILNSRPTSPRKSIRTPILSPKPKDIKYKYKSITNNIKPSLPTKPKLPPKLPPKPTKVERNNDLLNPSRTLPTLPFSNIYIKSSTYSIVAKDQLIVSNNSIKFYNIKQGNLISEIPLYNDNKVVHMKYTFFNRKWFLFVCLTDGQIWQIDNFKVVNKAYRVNAKYLFQMDSLLVCIGERNITLVDMYNIKDKITSFAMELQPHFIACKVNQHIWVAQNRQICIICINNEEIELLNCIDLDITVGNITCLAYFELKDIIAISHQDGKLSFINSSTYKIINTLLITAYKIQHIIIVKNNLWLITTNKILVLDLLNYNLIKEFEAHQAPIQHIYYDANSLIFEKQKIILSICENGFVRFWDGLLKEDWIDNKIKELKDDYCNYNSKTIRICSFNMDHSKPEDIKHSNQPNFLIEWINNNTDLIVIHFQEVVNLESKKMTAKTLFKRKEEDSGTITQRYNLWKNKIIQTITQSSEEYSLLTHQDMVGLYSLIFIKQKYKQDIYDLQIQTNKTGFGGYHGNKGGIIIRFHWFNSSLCFLNCHLAAGHSNVSQRNNDAFNIIKKTVLESNVNVNQLNYNMGDGKAVLDNENIIMAGDLNYRINLSRDKILQLIEHNDLQQLVQFDQLNVLKKQSNFLLNVFKEQKINFVPTYKYDPFTNTFDSSEKKRAPAYCDRVLYKGELKPKEYNRLECNISDHRPIVATFDVRIKSIDDNKLNITYKEVNKQWDELYHELIQEANFNFFINHGFDKIRVQKLLHKNICGQDLLNYLYE